MSRFLLTIAYDGSRYCGWQVQKNGLAVQQVVQDALEAVLQWRPGLTGCSRTDAGVHARMFCAHFDAEIALPPLKLVAAVNAHLPRDIVVRDCRQVAEDFHARYACKGKTYCYQILNARQRDPFLEGYAWQVKYPLAVEQMNTLAAQLVGRRDFASFCAAGSSVEDTVRTVSDCYFQRFGDRVDFYVTADGFLYNMVRIMVGTLVDLAREHPTAQTIPDILASKDRTRAGRTAPAQGLFLNQVYYAEEDHGGLPA